MHPENYTAQRLQLVYQKICADILLQNLRRIKLKKSSDSTQRIWIGILNRSLTKEIVIKKDKPLGFFYPRIQR